MSTTTAPLAPTHADDEPLADLRWVQDYLRIKSRNTVAELEKRGLITVIRLTPRCNRYVRAQIRALKAQGVAAR